MTINQKGVIDAYGAICKLCAQDVTMQTAYALSKIRKQIKEQIEFQIEQETKICKQIGAEIDANGNVSFPNEDAVNEFNQKREELNNINVNLENTPLDLRNEKVLLNADDIEALGPLVVAD